MLSYDQDRLLAPSKRKEVESALTLDQPLRLDRLGLVLGAIRVEFADYQLTKASILSFQSLHLRPTLTQRYAPQENCWAMASVILELLETEGRGTYRHGKLCFPEWAPEVRERVRDRFASALCASIRILLNCNFAEGPVAAILQRPGPTAELRVPETGDLASRTEEITCVSLSAFAEIVADLRVKEP